VLTIEDWFCCLHPRERTVLRSTAEALVLTLFLGFPKDIWDSFWFAAPDNGLAVRESFLLSYGLQIVTILVDDVEIEGIAPAPGFLSLWVEWSLFVVTPGAACLGGCEQSSFP
jgi:hypothetical protein